MRVRCRSFQMAAIVADQHPLSIPISGILATTFRVAGSTPTTCWLARSRAPTASPAMHAARRVGTTDETVSVMAFVAGSIRDHFASVWPSRPRPRRPRRRAPRGTATPSTVARDIEARQIRAGWAGGRGDDLTRPLAGCRDRRLAARPRRRRRGRSSAATGGEGTAPARAADRRDAGHETSVPGQPPSMPTPRRSIVASVWLDPVSTGASLINAHPMLGPHADPAVSRTSTPTSRRPGPSWSRARPSTT